MDGLALSAIPHWISFHSSGWKSLCADSAGSNCFTPQKIMVEALVIDNIFYFENHFSINYD